VHKACLLPYHVPSTPFTASITHTKLTHLGDVLQSLYRASATAEQSFSALRTLKTITRSTMNASGLADLALLHFHQDRNDKMDLNDLCETFVSTRSKEHRVSLANRRH